VADPLPVLGREPQMRGELAQGGGQAGDGGRIDALVAGCERLGAASRLLDSGLAGWLVDVVEDGPVGGLDLGLGAGWDLSEQVADTMKP
jgi:hypothetical protein